MSVRSSATLGILVQLAMLHTLAMPAGQDLASTLRITSSIDPGRTYLGDVLGPFVMGHHLTIACSTDLSDAVSLSWWEDDEQLPAVASLGDGNVSRSFILGTLQAEDSQRHFTCRELVSGAEKSVDLYLVDDHMEIQKDGISLEDEGKVDVIRRKGCNLNCVVNGTDPGTGLWWEGKMTLQAKRTRSNNAIHTQLALRPARNEDNRRKLTCRARNGQLTKTVVLNVVEGDGPVPGARSLPLQSPSLALTTTGTRPTTKTPANVTNMPLPRTDNEVKVYLVAGVAVITVIVVVVAILICVIVKMDKKIMTQESPISRQEGDSPEHRSDTSRTFTSLPNSLMSLDPKDLPPLSPLLPRPPHVEWGGETASSGGRMSVMRPDDRDHSYYYPDLINNSYYYPKITDDVKKTLLGNIVE